MFTGLKSVIYPSADLAKDTAFWTRVTGIKPYMNEPYYVGFHVDGNELGLDPNAHKQGLTYPVTYWNVIGAAAAADQLVKDGSEQLGTLRDVGGGMMLATFKDPSGNIFGIIDDPNHE